MSNPSVRFLFCSLSLLSCSFSEETKCPDGPRPYRVALSHIEGKGIGYTKGYTTLEGFFAWDKCERFVPFLDIRGHVFNDGKWAANAGIGGRYLVPSLARNFGANVYYDYRNTTHQHYNQVGAGLESLGTHWDYRVNGYFPVGDRTSRYYHTKFDEFKGHYAMLKRKKEFDMTGFDAEAGYHTKIYKDYPVYAAAGPYYISGKFGEHSWGVETRLAVGYKQYVKLEGSYSYDSIFRDIWQGQITFTMPFGKGHKLKKGTERSNRSCQEAYLVRESLLQDVNRKEIIVVDKHQLHQKAIDPATGKPYFFWFVDNTSHSAGTFESPFPTLAEAQAASKTNTIIYVFPGDGTTNGMNSGIVLKDNQRLWGASIPYGLKTTVGKIKIPSFASSMPVIGNSGGDVITIGNNNQIEGLLIQAVAGNGISQPNAGISVRNLKVAHNTILNTGTANYTVALNNMAGLLTIEDNLVNALSDNSIQIINSNINNANYLIENNAFAYKSDTLSAGSLINFNYTDSSGIGTQIQGNDFVSNGPCIAIVSTNSTLSNANSFAVTNNKIKSDNSFMNASFNAQANTVVVFNNNEAFTPNATGIVIQTGDSSQTTLNILDNIISTWESGIQITQGGNSQVTTTITNNKFVSDFSPALLFQFTDSSLITATIANNTIDIMRTIFGIFAISATNAKGDFTISNNSIFAAPIGINMVTLDQSQVGAVINDNAITASTSGVRMTTNTSSQGIWQVYNNSFIATAVNAVIVTANDTSTTCLQFNNNTAAPVNNAYLFTNNGATFNLEPSLGNTGIVTETGTITNVPVGHCK